MFPKILAVDAPFSPMLISSMAILLLNAAFFWITPASGRFPLFSPRLFWLSYLGSQLAAWARAWANGHALIVITSALVLMCVALQPLAGALLDVRDTYWDPQDCACMMIYSSFLLSDEG